MTFARIDHLVYAAPNLALAVEDFTARSGVTATPGGAHPHWGTRNALVGLGPGLYLEFIGPDPENAAFRGERPFRIDALDAPRLVTWAAKASPMDTVLAKARAAGYDPGPAHPGRRERLDGTLLEWSLTMPRFDAGDGLVPFLIDWGSSPHPSESAVAGCTLEAFRMWHAEPERIEQMLRAIGVPFQVDTGASPVIEAEIGLPDGGSVVLR